MRYSDPILDEVRAARDAIAKEFDYDIDKLAEAIKAREAKSGRTIVRLSPRAVTVLAKPHEGALAFSLSRLSVRARRQETDEKSVWQGEKRRRARWRTSQRGRMKNQTETTP
jgi:hypothetical protein